MLSLVLCVILLFSIQLTLTQDIVELTPMDTTTVINVDQNMESGTTTSAQYDQIAFASGGGSIDRMVQKPSYVPSHHNPCTYFNDPTCTSSEGCGQNYNCCNKNNGYGVYVIAFECNYVQNVCQSGCTPGYPAQPLPPTVQPPPAPVAAPAPALAPPTLPPCGCRSIADCSKCCSFPYPYATSCDRGQCTCASRNG